MAPSLKSPTCAYFPLLQGRDETAFALSDAVPVILLRDGAVEVGGHRIEAVDFDGRRISWSHQGADGYQGGSLQVSHDALLMSGTLSAGPNVAEATTQAVIATAFPPTVYKTRVTRMRKPVGTDPATVPDADWVYGLRFELGFVDDPGSGLPNLVVKLGKTDITDATASMASDKDTLTIAIDMSGTSHCDFNDNLYSKASLTLPVFGQTVSGTIELTCKEATLGQPVDAGVYLWTGTAQNPALHRLANNAKPMSVHSMATAARDPDLGLPDLLAQIPDDSVSDAAQRLLVENMKWALNQSPETAPWLSSFFNQTGPALSPDQQELAQRDADWLRSEFGVGYIAIAIDQQGASDKTLPQLAPGDRRKLHYFMTTGLGSSVPYGSQMTGLSRQAILTAKTRLQRYVDDGGEKWAQTLYDFVTEPATMTQQVNNIVSRHDASAMNNITALLSVLQPSGDLAKRYQQAMLSRMSLFLSTLTTVTDKVDAMETMPRILAAFVDAYAPKPGVRAMARAAQAPLEDEDERAETAEILAEAAEKAGGFTELAETIVDILIEAKGHSLMGQAESAQEAFARAYPGMAKVSKFIFFAAWAVGVFGVVVSFLDWVKLSATDRGQAVVRVVSLLGSAVGEVVGIFASKVSANMLSSLNRWAALKETDILSQEVMEGIAKGSWIEKSADYIKGSFDQATGEIITTGTRWLKVFKIADMAIKIAGVILAAAAAVLSTIAFVADLRSGKPISKAALDGIVAISGLAAAVSLAINLIVPSLVFSLAASIFAVIGLIAGLIALFLPPGKQETPAETFMEGAGMQFSQSLPEPPADWHGPPKATTA